jgi:hypothetical protein
LILSPGDKVHIITRRQFPEDIRRHFVGEVAAVQGALIRVMGYVFVYEPFDEKFAGRPEIRMRVFNCGESGLIVNILPPGTELDRVVYTVSDDNRLVATDGRDFRLDINEFSDRR